MGLLVEGVWRDEWYDTKSTGGKFVRKDSAFRHWITRDGAAGPTGASGFKAESGRYHLYISLACPWAHRAYLFRKLKGLEAHISLSVVHYLMAEHGWTFADGEGVIADPVINADYLYQIYTTADPKYTGRVTVPVLWDKRNNTIVSNESSEIIRMFNCAFVDVVDEAPDFYPEHLRDEIDVANEKIYHSINNGVYKVGFATEQAAYEEAFVALFTALDDLEKHFASHKYLVGEQITEADWRLFTTLVRFDSVYVGHFKCNQKRIVDYPNLWDYLKALYQYPGVKETVDMLHIKHHYYASHQHLNPSGIVPIGPDIHFMAPHTRG